MTRSILCCLVACAAAAHAQSTHLSTNAVVPKAKSAADAAYLASMGLMRSDLRNLITAQEIYETGNKTFANDIELLPTFHPMMGAHVDIVSSQSNGWAAIETMPVGAGVGRSCVIWVGSIDKSDRPSTESERKTFPEAEVACDGDGLSQRAEWAAAAQSYMAFALRKLAKSERPLHDGRIEARAVHLGPRRVGRDRRGHRWGLGRESVVRPLPRQNLRHVARRARRVGPRPHR
jgi:hypothetical protein